MHDIGHDHADDHGHNHLHDETDHGLEEAIYLHDNVDLRTVGVDIGSSTYHLMFARVHLQRETQGHSSRFEVIEREVLWRSEIQMTPYRRRRIDSDAVRAFVTQSYERAGIEPRDIDSGAVILTGEALHQRNARALADAVAAGSGVFVCVSAGHHLEAMLAAFGSGAVQYSLLHEIRLFHIDIGGGTTKLSYIENGQVRATAAVTIGGRQIAMDEDRIVRSVSSGAATIARAAEVSLAVGRVLELSDEKRFVSAQVDVLVDLASGAHKNLLERKIRLTRVLPRGFVADAVSFSGGVSEYIYGRETRGYGDLGPQIGGALLSLIETGTIGLPVVDPGEGIRATVAGASQCSVQLSGSTVVVSDPALLPLHNIPVIHPDLADRLADVDFAPDRVDAAIRSAVNDYGLKVTDALAIAINWRGDPLHARLSGLADGIARALGSLDAPPVVVLIDQDIGASIGRLLREVHGFRRPLICLDGLSLSPLDFVDVGQIIEPSGSLPVVIKSLLFSAEGSQR